MASYNVGRLSEDIKREISAALRDIKDGKVVKALVSVSRCELTSDLSYCKVFVTTLDGGKTTEDIAARLQKAEGFFKKRINQRVKMRKMPQLIFVADTSTDYYEHISEVLSRLPGIKSAQSGESGEDER